MNTEYHEEIVTEENLKGDFQEIILVSRFSPAGVEAIRRMDEIVKAAKDADLYGGEYMGFPTLVAVPALEEMALTLDRAMDYYDGGIGNPVEVPFDILVNAGVNGMENSIAASLLDAVTEYTDSRSFCTDLAQKVWDSVMRDFD